MLTFLEYKYYNVLLEASDANTHSTHIEDLCITDKKKGIAKALGGILFIKKQFGISNASKSPAVTIKIDGAPSLVCGHINNKFFVATKSLFNKEPKINFTEEDIDSNHSGGLAEKLKLALKYLKEVIPKGKIYQGDFLFDSETRKSVTINGVDSWAWQPNTIQYSVDKNSKLGKRIGTAKFGIIFHTEYTSNGIDVSSIHLKGFGVKDSDLHPSKDVWFMDAYHHDISNITAFSKEQLAELTQYESIIKQNQFKIDWNYDDTTKKHLLTFINTYIRDNRIQPDPKVKAQEFHEYIKSKSESAINSKKTEKGKLAEANKWKSVLEYSINEKSITTLFTVHNAITAMKMILIRKLDSVKNIKTFLVKSNGDIVVTGNEGFVLAKTSASGVKLVDRYEFSRANFSNDYVKGWEH